MLCEARDDFDVFAMFKSSAQILAVLYSDAGDGKDRFYKCVLALEQKYLDALFARCLVLPQLPPGAERPKPLNVMITAGGPPGGVVGTDPYDNKVKLLSQFVTEVSKIYPQPPFF